jgi:hypothetical protein
MRTQCPTFNGSSERRELACLSIVTSQCGTVKIGRLIAPVCMALLALFSRIENTVRYLDIEVDESIEIAEKIDI